MRYEQKGLIVSDRTALGVAEDTLKNLQTAATDAKDSNRGVDASFVFFMCQSALKKIQKIKERTR